MNLIDIKIKNTSNNPLPEYQTKGAAGFDIRADLKESVMINPGERFLVPTGLFFELPNYLELQIRPRSGLAIKNGITVLNSPGTVDSDYRGEVKIILINHGNEPFEINSGDRIAQGVISTITPQSFLNFKEVDILSETDRNSDGFGTTGIK